MGMDPDIEKAREWLELAVESEDSMEAKALLGRILLLLGDEEMALTYLDQVINNDDQGKDNNNAKSGALRTWCSSVDSVRVWNLSIYIFQSNINTRTQVHSVRITCINVMILHKHFLFLSNLHFWRTTKQSSILHSYVFSDLVEYVAFERGVREYHFLVFSP